MLLTMQSRTLLPSTQAAAQSRARSVDHCCYRPQHQRRFYGDRSSSLRVNAAHSARSYDDEAGLPPDTDIKKQTERLALLWKVQTARLRRPEPCVCCQGSGERECSWCHGTGVLMLGDSLVCSTSEHNCKCLACKSTGYIPCANCRGTGYRAKWLGGNTTCDL